MGDMADYYLDMIDYSDYDFESQPSDVRCRYCKRRGFHWCEQSNGQWRLVTLQGKLHVCKKYERRPLYE